LRFIQFSSLTFPIGTLLGLSRAQAERDLKRAHLRRALDKYSALATLCRGALAAIEQVTTAPHPRPSPIRTARALLFLIGTLASMQSGAKHGTAQLVFGPTFGFCMKRIKSSISNSRRRC